ncbi:hypothetical protein SCLCIDRAFT_20501 [Scleroderma citrinum Foug A]|uniref:Uncharacterized protein n=1 Tax=Scleroderma citrinum Foug A TaxID=1036808 RepID=A0A0C3A308_9AGAM|nr:hypothetical protein SCLCIDRAFT_20501 [Scleroderma citrinum Foug A]
MFLHNNYKQATNILGETWCHTPNMFGTVDIGIISSAFQKLKSFFKNIFIGLKHLEEDYANNMTVQQYYCETYNIHIK